MKVFISWSGEKSKLVAEELTEWMCTIIPSGIQTFYSSEDIRAGDRWFKKISKELESSNYGIICLTEENLSSPWIHFEAGALSKQIDISYICPITFGFNITNISGPLLQFQCKNFNKNDMRSLIFDINSQLDSSHKINNDRLEKLFEQFWPELDSHVKNIIKRSQSEEKLEVRSDREIIEEILYRLRLISGPQKVYQTVDDLNNLGVSRIYKDRTDINIAEFINNAESGSLIRLLGICMMGFTNVPMQEALSNRLKDGCKIQFLTLDSKSDYINLRAKEENRKIKDIASDIASSNKTHRNFIQHGIPKKYYKNIELRHYDSSPNCFLISIDSQMIVSFYLSGQRGEYSPHFLLNIMEDGMSSSFLKHFEDAWETAKKSS